MSSVQQALFREFLRRDLVAFYHKTFREVTNDTYLHNWHIDLLADRLTQCFEGKLRRLIICVPPRSGKSLMASVAFPAWVMGHRPDEQIMTLSYGQRLSSDFCRQQAQIMRLPWYQELFSRTRLNPKKCTEEEFETTAGGRRIATSTMGAVTGRGANMIIIDDIIKPLDAKSDDIRTKTNHWVEHTLLSRLNDKVNGVIIVIMQRVHNDDFVAHLAEKGGWEILNLPAIAVADEEFTLSNGKRVGRKQGEALHPAREPLEALRDLEHHMTVPEFLTQYQQMPQAPGGNLIKRDWFMRYDRQPCFHEVDLYQSWDTASKTGETNDWSVGITWLVHEGNYIILDVFRDRLDFPGLRDAVIAQRKKWKGFAKHPPMVIIEDAGAGTSLAQDLRSRGVSIREVQVEGSKQERAQSCSLLIHNGKVWLPRQAPWLEAFERELMAFPNGRHDDQVDAMTLFLTWYRNRRIIRTGRARGMY